MGKRRRLFDTMRDAQLHVDDVTHRLSHLSPDHPDFDKTLDEFDHALLERTRAEAAHARGR